MNYASIVPLIGGETIAMENVFGKKPEYILSYKAFEANDSQLLNYYGNSVPYILLDEGGRHPSDVSVVNTVCPCAGLSSLSTTSSSDSSVNDWMVRSAEYVLESIRPNVFWGENAPRLASKMGEPIVRKLRAIARKNGYTLSLYKTKSILHGLSQTRDRSFYFFWKGNTIPLFEYYNRPHTLIEDQIRSSARNDPDPMSDIMVTEGPPSFVDPYYRFILDKLQMDHMTFYRSIDGTINTMEYIEKQSWSYEDVATFMDTINEERTATKARRIYGKLKSGGNVMRRTTTFPVGHIGAFVGHLPSMITHPDTDRYLNIRECLDIMKMPKDFQLAGGRRNVNMICQNVPVTTAMDMAENVKNFLSGNAHEINTDFLIQDNKTQTYDYEKKSVSLEEVFA